MSSAIVRQWMILSMLPVRPRRIDSGALEERLRARGIEVHRRTIQRDLIELAQVFPIVANDRAKPFGWRWSDEASFIARLAPAGGAKDEIDVTVRVGRGRLEAFLQMVARVEGASVVAPLSLGRVGVAEGGERDGADLGF